MDAALLPLLDAGVAAAFAVDVAAFAVVAAFADVVAALAVDVAFAALDVAALATLDDDAFAAEAVAAGGAAALELKTFAGAAVPFCTTVNCGMIG